MDSKGMPLEAVKFAEKPPLLIGPYSTIVDCPFCNTSVKTRIDHTSTIRTHKLAIRLLFCCCIPYCLNSAKNTDHYCPNCFRYLGTYKK